MNDSVLSMVSTISGYASFTIWLFAQLPQIIENHLNHSVEGVNVLFLGSWITGDFTNLLGCLLTHALPFQTLIASYYCFIDVILTFQYYYYTKIFPYHKVPHNLLQSPNMLRTPSSDRMNRFNESSSLLSRTPRSKRSSFLNIIAAGLVTKKASALPLYTNEIQHVNSDIIGAAFAWICSFFYLAARIPQIITNYKNRSTTGISPYLFLFALLGNSFYSISIVIDLYIHSHTPEVDWAANFWDQLPFLVGTGGTVVFDFILLFQCWYYKKPKVKKQPSTRYLNGAFQKPDWYISNFVYEDDDQLDDHTKDNIIQMPPPHHYVTGSYVSKSVRSKSPSIHSPNLQTSLIPSIINSYSSVSKKMANDKTPFLPSDFLNDEFHVPVENSLFSLNT